MITANQVKELREKTGAGMMDCKKVLAETNGDEEKAIELLRERGIAKAAKKSDRIAAEGLVTTYVSSGINACLNFKSGKIKCKAEFPSETVIGALANYISTSNKNFQPMNANFGILPELDEKIRDKKIRYEKMAQRSLKYYRSITNM